MDDGERIEITSNLNLNLNLNLAGTCNSVAGFGAALSIPQSTPEEMFFDNASLGPSPYTGRRLGLFIIVGQFRYLLNNW